MESRCRTPRLVAVGMPTTTSESQRDEGPAAQPPESKTNYHSMMIYEREASSPKERRHGCKNPGRLDGREDHPGTLHSASPLKVEADIADHAQASPNQPTRIHLLLGTQKVPYQCRWEVHLPDTLQESSLIRFLLTRSDSGCDRKRSPSDTCGPSPTIILLAAGASAEICGCDLFQRPAEVLVDVDRWNVA